jgi:hypothetical protein
LFRSNTIGAIGLACAVWRRGSVRLDSHAGGVTAFRRFFDDKDQL